MTAITLSGTPIQNLELVRNGEVVKTWQGENDPASGGAYRNEIRAEVKVESSTWLAIRAFETGPQGKTRFAHSAPIFIDVPGKPLRPRKHEVEYLAGRVRAQIERSKDVLPPEAVSEYRRALEIYEKIVQTARP